MARRHLSNYVRNARLSAGLTCAELGALLGYSESTVRRCEAGERNFSVRFVFGCTMIFGRPASSLFPELVKSIQDKIGRSAAILDTQLRHRSDKTSAKKKALLHEFLDRTVAFPDL